MSAHEKAPPASGAVTTFGSWAVPRASQYTHRLTYDGLSIKNFPTPEFFRGLNWQRRLLVAPSPKTGSEVTHGALGETTGIAVAMNRNRACVARRAKWKRLRLWGERRRWGL